jgi:hypothetical protein
MGTNYNWYASADPCKACGREASPRHIGKSSAGWVFALHVYPDVDIQDLEAWKTVWARGRIEDEYGRVIDPKDMERIVTQRSARNGKLAGTPRWDGATWEPFTNEFS